MGSGGSKACGGNGAPSSSSSGVRRTRSMGSRVFQYSCLRLPSGSLDSDSDDHLVLDHHNKENGCDGPCTNSTETDADQVKIDCYRKVKVEQPDELPCISSNVGLDEWGRTRLNNTASGGSSNSARASSTQSLNPSTRFLSRFSFIPGNISFRLSRATSVGSSRAYPVSSTSFTISDNEEEFNLHTGPASGLANRNQSPEGSNLLPACVINRYPTPRCQDTSGNQQSNLPASGLSDNLHAERIISSHEGIRDGLNTGMGFDVNLHSPRNHAEIETNQNRLADRRIGVREPVERNVRFSRTLSVGRLRDRVLRRSSFSDLTFCPLQQDREVRDASQSGGRQAWDGDTRASPSDSNVVTSPSSSGHPLSSLSSSLFSSEDYEMETSRPREARYHDLLEHRSNFLERRRRIRSQVRALQRLGNRFENLSGHERSCILSGQHRTGRCTCRISTRYANSNDDTGARASISRIVMLAEALFEQSVVLSSRPSVSSIGSVPAPNEVVESLPVKLYTRVQKHQNEDAAQCYICLVEYEEEDMMRILPCHHEFHKTCIDKWLKEIHRVCPLCRGDICSSDSLPAEN